MIKLARFKSFGCGTAIASSDVMAELCIGKTVDEVVKITNIDVEHELRDDENHEAIPPQKMHCSVMAYDVIKKAVSLYKNIEMESLEQEEIVCQCARVSLSTIKEVIKINDLKTVEEIVNYTKAGAFCKSCIQPGGHETRPYYLSDILRETREEMAKDELHKTAKTTDFLSMGLVQKIHAIDAVLHEHVASFLAADGGSVEVVDVKDKDEAVEIYIEYAGACKACPSSKTGTLAVIEKVLKENLSDKIRVIVL